MKYSDIEHQKLFFHYINENPFLFDKVSGNFFKNKTVNLLYELSKKYYKENKESLSKNVAKLLVVNDDNYEDLIDEIDTIYENYLQSTEDYVNTSIKEWISLNDVTNKLIKSIEILKTSNLDTKNLISNIKSLISKVEISVDDDLGVDFFDYKNHEMPLVDKLSSGYEFYDNLSEGGYDRKTLICYLGQSNLGKSFFLANDAIKLVKLGYNVLFISAEMSSSKVIKRMGSNLLNINNLDYRTLSMDNEYISTQLNSVNIFNNLGNLRIKEVPTSSYTVDEIIRLGQKIEERYEYKLDVIIVDYIGILKNQGSNGDLYGRIKEIAEHLRGGLVENNWLGITAQQINRSGFDSSDIDLSTVAESAALIHTCDVMYGIIRTPEMYANSEYYLKLLKNRDYGGIGLKTKLMMNWSYYRLIETADAPRNVDIF